MNLKAHGSARGSTCFKQTGSLVSLLTLRVHCDPLSDIWRFDFIRFLNEPHKKISYRKNETFVLTYVTEKRCLRRYE